MALHYTHDGRRPLGGCPPEIDHGQKKIQLVRDREQTDCPACLAALDSETSPPNTIPVSPASIHYTVDRVTAIAGCKPTKSGGVSSLHLTMDPDETNCPACQSVADKGQGDAPDMDETPPDEAELAQEAPDSEEAAVDETPPDEAQPTASASEVC